jgi:hypothetical protein
LRSWPPSQPKQGRVNSLALIGQVAQQSQDIVQRAFDGVAGFTGGQLLALESLQITQAQLGWVRQGPPG